MQIKFENIKPIGNLEEVLKTFRILADKAIEKAHNEKKFNNDLSKIIKTIVGEFAIIEILEEGIETNDCWNIDEAIIDLLYTHLIIVDVNSVAHLYLNNISMKPSKEQLQEYCKESNNKIYHNIEII